MKIRGYLFWAGLALMAAGCAPVEVKPTSVAELASKVAEQSLLAGLKAYDDGEYEAAEIALRKALAERLAFPRDVATAWKFLAFIHCISNRGGECEAAFREAFAADPAFDLATKERGHPLWGPVFLKVKETPRPAPARPSR
jgi:Tfp pilus assembly protein PilF